jgi:hypothetical protein
MTKIYQDIERIFLYLEQIWMKIEFKGSDCSFFCIISKLDIRFCRFIKCLKCDRQHHILKIYI